MWNDAAKILSAARKLADTLRESELYQAYRKSRIQLERYPDVAAQLKEFKQAGAAHASRRTLSFDEERHISHLYAELTRHPAAAAFLEREQVLLDTYGKMIDVIDEAWEMDLFE